MKKIYKDKIKLIAVTADPDIRYQRLGEREVRSYLVLDAQNRDEAEIKNLNIEKTIKKADFKIVNEQGLEDLKKQVEGILENIR